VSAPDAGDRAVVADLLDRALAGRVLAPRGDGDAAGTGDTRLVCVDGLAGAGKTTLARRIAEEAARRGLGATVVHVDDLLAGWGGLLDVGATLARDVVAPLRAGRPGRYRRYDWLAGAFEDAVTTVLPSDVVVLEGCGSAPPEVGELAALVIYVEAPDDLRLARGLARDGEEARAHWLGWMADELRLAERDRTRERADVVVDTTAPGTTSRPDDGASPG